MKTLTRILYFLLIIVEVIILFRFVFFLINANTDTVWASFIMQYSGYLLSPFKNLIDADWNIGKFFIEVDSLVALLSYMIIGFGLSQLLKVLS